MQSTSSGPLVSVIIPFLDAGATLERALRSCLAQTHPAVELVLVDNGSTDAGPRVARRICEAGDRPWRLLHCAERGVNRARLMGQEAAGGDYVQWLDADDTLPTGKLAQQVNALESRPDCDIAYGDWRWHFELPGDDPRLEVERLERRVYAAAYGERRWKIRPGATPRATLHFRLQQFDDYLLRLLEDRWIPPHGYLLRRSAAARLVKLDALDPALPVATDRVYFTTAALTGMRFLHVPGSTVDYHTWSRAQISTSTPPAVRAVHLARSFRRLRELAGESPLHMGARHRLLLELDRGLWRSPGPSLRILGDDGRILEHNGTRIRIGACAASVARALACYTAELPLEDHAKILALRVPGLWERHTLLVRMLKRFARLGLLERLQPR